VKKRQLSLRDCSRTRRVVKEPALKETEPRVYHHIKEVEQCFPDEITPMETIMEKEKKPLQKISKQTPIEPPLPPLHFCGGCQGTYLPAVSPKTSKTKAKPCQENLY
jgi:hypothetical protein